MSEQEEEECGIDLENCGVDIKQENSSRLCFPDEIVEESSGTYYTVTSCDDTQQLITDDGSELLTHGDCVEASDGGELGTMHPEANYMSDHDGQIICTYAGESQVISMPVISKTLNCRPAFIVNVPYSMELTDETRDEDELLTERPLKRVRVETTEGHGYDVLLTYDDESFEQSVSEDQELGTEDGETDGNLLPSEKCASEDVNQAWFTTKTDKVALHCKGHRWKQGQWTKEEVELLQTNIAAYCQQRHIGDPGEVIFHMSKDERKDFYRSVARGLHRPLFSVYRRVIRMYDQKNYVGKYTPEEIEQLRELRKKHGTDWAAIGAVLGRSASSVKDRCRLMKETCNAGKWFPEEEKLLTEAVYFQSGVSPGESVTSGLSWANVAEYVGTRSEKQCRTKWLNYLNWKQKGGVEWTRDDDLLLLGKLEETNATDENAVNWKDLSDQWPSVRSPQWLRGKWWSMKRHIKGYQEMKFKALLSTVRTFHLQAVRIPQFVSALISDIPATSTSASSTELAPELKAEQFDLAQIRFGVPFSISVDGQLTSETLQLCQSTDDSESQLATFEVLTDDSGGQLGELQAPTGSQHAGAFLVTSTLDGSAPSAYYEISGVTADGVVIQTHAEREEVDDHILVNDGVGAENITLHGDVIQGFHEHMSSLVDDQQVQIISSHLGIANDADESTDVDGNQVIGGLKSANLSSSDIEIMPMDDSFTEVIAVEEEPGHCITLTSTYSTADITSFSDALLTSSSSDLLTADDIEISDDKSH